MYPDEDEELEKMDAEFEEYAIKTGGGGSNMAEPPWVPPGPVKIPDGLPPEERARRERLLEELKNDPPFRNLRT